ncbi:MAG TPA: pyridoxal-phosphate dependent enzyme [Actinomycetota bacterium]|nr:pyridoxal-phosphate dependent enzyme [Actinomycetota bacterium]
MAPGTKDPLWQTVCTECHQPAGDAYAPYCPSCNAMTRIEYDLDRVELRDSPNPYVRFRDLLPIRDESLLPTDATYTRLVHSTAFGEKLGMSNLYLKDETSLPTGTTKDRMAAIALPYLYEGGLRAFCTSSTGNSSTAYSAALGRVPGITMYLFTAEDFARRLHIPESPQVVNFVLKDATFVEAFDAARAWGLNNGLTPERGFFNPGRREGLKVAFLETIDQIPEPPEWYFQAVSSSTGVYGIYEGAAQLRAMGAIDKLPRLVCVQQASCCPMVTAWEAGSDAIRKEDIIPRPVGIAKAILRGNPTATYPLMRNRVVETDGTFKSVTEQEIRDARKQLEDLEGISPCFAAATAVAGMVKMRKSGELPADDMVLVNVTGRDRDEEPTIGEITWMERSDDGWVPAA